VATATVPDRGTLHELVAAATRAPSVHNVQPWRFRPRPGGLEVHIDRMRALPVHDPFDRELTISVGAAVTTLEVAARAAGWGPRTRVHPSEHDPDLLAVVELGERAVPSDDDIALAAAITQRVTHRGAFRPDALPDGLLPALVAAGEDEGVALVPIEGEAALTDLAAVVAGADRTQFGDVRWRRELAMWMHPERTVDGMPLPPGSSLWTRLTTTTPGEVVHADAPDRSLVLTAPLVAVLTTTEDQRGPWLTAGRALQRVLLTAARAGVQAGYLSQACQVEDARRGVRYLVGGERHPQSILRFGVPDRPRRLTDRRPVDHVLDTV
jgi:hypothetical protein